MAVLPLSCANCRCSKPQKIGKTVRISEDVVVGADYKFSEKQFIEEIYLKSGLMYQPLLCW